MLTPVWRQDTVDLIRDARLPCLALERPSRPPYFGMRNPARLLLHAAPTAKSPAGALFAVHDDRSIAAFDLRAIATALRLPAACLH